MYSSITFKILSIRPSAVWSNWKSAAQMTFGRIGHIARGTPMPRSGFLPLAIGHPQALCSPQAMDALVVHPPAFLRPPWPPVAIPNGAGGREGAQEGPQGELVLGGDRWGRRWVERG